jgi:hypothetical protein
MGLARADLTARARDYLAMSARSGGVDIGGLAQSDRSGLQHGVECLPRRNGRRDLRRRDHPTG